MKYILLFFIFFSSLFSQEEKPSYWIGANGGLNLNINNAKFDGLPGYDCCSEGFENQIGFSYYFGLLFKYEIIQDLKLDIRLNYKPYAGAFNETQVIGNTTVVDPNNNVLVVDALSEITIEPTMSLFGLDVGVEYNLLKNISVLGGLSPSYIIQGNFSQNEKIIEPNNVVYADNQSKERNRFDNEEIPDLNKIQFQAFIGGAYKHELKKDNYLNFEVKYYQALTNISSVDWSLSNLFAGISYEYPIYPKKVKEILRDTIYQRDTTNLIVYDKNEERIELIDSKTDLKENEDDDIKYETLVVTENYNNYIFDKTDISAKLRIYGINEDGTTQNEPTITIEEIESEQGFPVLPYIFFDVNNSDLAKTSQVLLTKSEVSDFNENNLSWDVFEVYNNTLNIIAKRIRDNNLRIELIGNRIVSTNNIEDSKIPEERVKSIKKYFTNVWGIDENKISTKIIDIKLNDLSKNDDLFKEANRVEINSKNINVIEPVFLKEIIKSSNPPKIGVDATISSTKPPVNWELNINQKDKNIRNYTGNELKFTKIWQVDEEPMPILEDKIEFKLNVKDDFNGKTEVVEDLKIKQLTIKKKREVLHNDKKIEKYSLIVFDYNSAELKETHKEIIEKVKKSIKPNSVVTIAGYADRTGELEYNKQLATQRIQSVKKLMNVPAEYKLIPYGSSVLLYDNSTEVGRSLSRTVQITIETPIE